MTADEITALLESNFSNAQIKVEGEGAKFHVAIVSDDFVGKRAVPRQQMIYALLNEQIASGEIHAVTMDLKTSDEVA